MECELNQSPLAHCVDVLNAIECDVICLQEIKCETDAFPYMEIEELGYNVAAHGQKSYNGVALLSKHPIEDVQKNLPTYEDDQARYIEALIMADKPIRVGGLYLPNGNPAPGPKYDYKLEWMAGLQTRRALLAHEEAFVLCGDYNVIPRMKIAGPVVWVEDGLALPTTRAPSAAEISWVDRGV